MKEDVNSRCQASSSLQPGQLYEIRHCDSPAEKLVLAQGLAILPAFVPPLMQPMVLALSTVSRLPATFRAHAMILLIYN